MKFCINCRHFIPYMEIPCNQEYGRCAKSPVHHNERYDNWLVTGIGAEPIAEEHQYCSVWRTAVREDSCGVEARFFEPKEVA